MCQGAYHGTSDSVVMEGGNFFSESIPEEVSKSVIVIPFNDAQTIERTIKEFKEEIAAVIVEPVLGAGGEIPARNDFLKMVRETTEEYDILLMFDEIQTGFRLALGGAQEFFNVIPDIFALGKGVTGVATSMNLNHLYMTTLTKSVKTYGMGFQRYAVIWV